MRVTSTPWPQAVKPTQFQGKSTDGYESDSVEALEEQLQNLLINVPQDEFVSTPAKINFKYKDPQVASASEVPQEDSPSPKIGRFQTLTAEAAAAIPPIRAMDEQQGLGKVLADQLQTLIRQGVEAKNTRGQKSSSEQANFIDDAAKQRQLDEQKEIEKNHQLAKQKIVQLGLNTIGLATFGVVASSAFAVTAPVGAAGAAAMLALGKLSAASALLGYTSNLFNTATELIGNKQSSRAVKSLISSFWGRFGRAYSFGKQVLGNNKSGTEVRFAGSKEQVARQGQSQASADKLEAQCKQASEQFMVNIDKATNEVEKNQVAQTLQKSLLGATQAFILENGTDEEKQKIRQVQKFQTNYETLVHAMAASSSKKLTDLPPAAQNHLRQMIFDTLTSAVPELQDWGKKQGRAIGMTMTSINSLLYRTKP